MRNGVSSDGGVSRATAKSDKGNRGAKSRGREEGSRKRGRSSSGSVGTYGGTSDDVEIREGDRLHERLRKREKIEAERNVQSGDFEREKVEKVGRERVFRDR